jgi:hypothetical protein
MNRARGPAPVSELPILQVRNSGWLQLEKVDDGVDGNLCIMEELRNVPFSIKRVYFINRLDNNLSVRGKHAHRELRQAIFCISGSFVLTLDDGEREQDVLMHRDDVGILLEPGLWHVMHSFTSGCVVLVAASDYFAEKDYIRDYADFKRWIGR